MEEKTIEELQAELKALKKENLERQIAAEKEKAEEANRLAEAKKAEEYKEEIRKEVMAELANDSTIETTAVTKPETLAKPKGNYDNFIALYRKNHNLSGKTYEQQIEEIANKGGY